MINKELLVDTLATIKANPQYWDQTQWHCGTTHCFAGFVELLYMDLPITINSTILKNDDRFYKDYYTDWKTPSNARELLGLTNNQSDALFHPTNTLEDLERIVGVLVTS